MMKNKFLITLFSALLCFTASWAQTTNAQEAGDDGSFFWHIHQKDDNPRITLDTKAEEIMDYLLAEPGRENYVMKTGTWLALERKVTDSFGNVHVSYNQKTKSWLFSDYQLVLHFRPDGSLYYTNGNIILEPKEAQMTRAIKPESMISAESAAVIATGSPMSESVFTFANCKNKPREAYKVKDMAKMQYVYVDAYSGEVLYTIPLFNSLAPWDEVKGNAVTLSANTSYNGLQELTVMQTDKGYILRDPERNIITVDATDVLATDSPGSFPGAFSFQIKKTLDNCDDVLFADKEDLLNQQYTTGIRGVTIWLDPKMEEVPESFNFQVYCLDDNDPDFVMDIINTDISNIEWTDIGSRMRCSFSFDECPEIPSSGYTQVVKVTIGDDEYMQKNIMLAGNTELTRLLKDGKSTDVLCLFDIKADATQPSIDIHWATQKIYDMYDEYFGIKGCDGKGTQTVNIVNPSNNNPAFAGLPLNATASNLEINDPNGVPSYVMYYGMGGSGIYKPLTAVDITAHEYTHNVTAASCNNLIFQNESGALNEALADCMAMVAEEYMFGEPTWTIGEKIALDADNFRSLSDPWYSGCKNGEMTDNAQPKYYAGQHWFDYITADPKDPRYDIGGVHTNSGVFNYLFYLLCEGGEGLTNEKNETADIIPVGMDKMKDILFHSMRYYNAKLCDYAEIADNLLIAIEALYSGNGDMISDLQMKLLTAYGFVGMRSEMKPTDITRPKMSNKNLSNNYYDLQGRRVATPTKSIYIKDGKKIFR